MQSRLHKALREFTVTFTPTCKGFTMANSSEFICARGGPFLAPAAEETPSLGIRLRKPRVKPARSHKPRLNCQKINWHCLTHFGAHIKTPRTHCIGPSRPNVAKRPGAFLLSALVRIPWWTCKKEIKKIPQGSALDGTHIYRLGQASWTHHDMHAPRPVIYFEPYGDAHSATSRHREKTP
jgi:hypothetical protein